MLGAVLFPAIAFAQASEPRFTVSDVRDDLTADAIVGARKSGLLCTPAGRLAWRTVAPTRQALIGGVAAAAKDAGLPVRLPNADDFDQEVRTPFRVVVTIDKVRVTACVPWMGLRVGKQARQRVSGELHTTWRVFDQKRRMLVSKVSLCADFKYQSGSPDLSQAITGTLAKLVPVVVERIRAAEPLEHVTGPDPLATAEPCRQLTV